MKMLVITSLKTLEYPFVSRDKLDWKGEGLRKFISVTYIVIISDSWYKWEKREESLIDSKMYEKSTLVNSPSSKSFKPWCYLCLESVKLH